MDSLNEKAKAAKAAMQGSNPANETGKRAPGQRARIPLSVPQRKLEVPNIPGYWLRWIRGTSQRLGQAQRAGFEFVQPDEVELNDVSFGGDATKAGNSDMGSHVSVIEGSEVDGTGQAIRMFLMKQKMEYYIEDSNIIQDRNDSVADALTGQLREGQIGVRAPGSPAEDTADINARYVDKARSKMPELFRRKTPRAKAPT